MHDRPDPEQLAFPEPVAEAGSALRCRTPELRRMIETLVPVVGEDEALARRLNALQVELAAVEALELRAVLAPGAPSAALFVAAEIRTGELGVAVAELVVAALGYQVLPAPDAHRQHNELPEMVDRDPAGNGVATGPDAIAALLRYVAGLDAMGARDRLAGLTGLNPHEG